MGCPTHPLYRHTDRLAHSPSPLCPLQCRDAIRNSMGVRVIREISGLQVHSSLKSFLSLGATIRVTQPLADLDGGASEA